MKLEEAIEWLARYDGKIEFLQFRPDCRRVTVTARNRTVARAWTQIEEDQSTISVPVSELVRAVEDLDSSIGS